MGRSYALGRCSLSNMGMDWTEADVVAAVVVVSGEERQASEEQNRTDETEHAFSNFSRANSKQT